MVIKLRRYFFSQAVIYEVSELDTSANSKPASLPGFSALVWAISTTAKALSAYTTRGDVSRMYRWRCPKRGIGARLHETPLRAARTARRRKKLIRIPPSALVQRSREWQPRDRARMSGSKHGSSRQNGIAEAASGHAEFTDARPSLELWRPHWIILHRYRSICVMYRRYHTVGTSTS